MQINHKREIKFTYAVLAATLFALSGLLYSMSSQMSEAWAMGETRVAVETGLFILGSLILAYSNLLYQICMIAGFKRMSKFQEPAREALDAYYEGQAPALSIIIPSYKEERIVNWQTMMSAALSEYPGKEVVLLIDDPYQPKVLEDILKLDDTRLLPGELQRTFDAQAVVFRAEQAAFEARRAAGDLNTEFERAHLASHYEAVAAWLEEVEAEAQGNRVFEDMTHSERFFAEAILRAPAGKHRALAETLRNESHPLSEQYLARQYARLCGLFTVRFSSFERKKYVNLSHEANKAMNLNSYIDLMGKSWREVEMKDGLHLVECDAAHATIRIPRADYINTIDSDTLMLGDYSLRLVQLMEQPENHRVAVCQSPCSTIPGATGIVERLGGAMIDVQFMTHQGYTQMGATFWVGANAMLRHTAMLDIKEVNTERGYPVPVYIQDRTVIEDTESSIDLVDKGWQLQNYPVRMTYSAMPPDFGSLLIQRRRWSNGGLIILPKLLRYAMRAKKDWALAKEMLVRFNYLASTTTNVAAVLMMAFYPFKQAIVTPWLFATTFPVMVMFARDLRLSGYRPTDAIRYVPFGLLLVPVVTGGVFKQFQQIFTGKKIPFGRTPKVTGRTATPPLYCLAQVSMLLLCIASLVKYGVREDWPKALIAAINMIVFAYGIHYFMGAQAIWEDMTAPLRARLRRNTHQAQIIHLPTAQPLQPVPAAVAVRA